MSRTRDQDRKMTPNCSTEYRHHSVNTSGEHSQQNTSKPKNWWDPPEEEETERLSEDDTSTDKCEGNESTDQRLNRKGLPDKRSAVGFCLGSGLFGSYNSD